VNPGNIMNVLEGQGPVFWAAAAAMAAGLTLLIVSLLVQVRRIQANRTARTARTGLARGVRKQQTVEVAATPPVRIDVTDDNYVATPQQPAQKAPTNLSALHRRLQAAADRLEEIRESRTPDTEIPGFTTLARVHHD